MASEAKQTKTAKLTLRALQAKQRRAARKLARLREKVDRRAKRFQKLESKIAELEHRLSGDGAAPERTALRPARLVVNDASDGFKRLAGTAEHLVSRLRAHGIDPEVHIKTSGKELRAWVKEAVKAKAPLIIVAGGDGTLVDVVGQMVGTDTVLGIIPSGTMNNIARELGIPLDLEQACALLGAGNTRQVDMGCVRAGDQKARSYFLETAGVGLAVALPAGQNVKKGRWGKLPSAFRDLFASGANPIVVELDGGQVIETKVHLVTVSNAPLYALNNLIAPEAKMDDGLLDVAVYDGLSALELAAYFVKTAGATRVADPSVRFFRTRRVRIRSRDELPVTADNVAIAREQAVEMEVVPKALTVIVGRGAALDWPVEAVASVPPLAGPPEAHKSDPVVATNGHKPEADVDVKLDVGDLAYAGDGRQ